MSGGMSTVKLVGLPVELDLIGRVAGQVHHHPGGAEVLLGGRRVRDAGAGRGDEVEIAPACVVWQVELSMYRSSVAPASISAALT